MLSFERNSSSRFTLTAILVGAFFLSCSDAAANATSSSLGGEIANLNGSAFSSDGGSYRQNFCKHYEELIDQNITDVGIANVLGGEEIHISLLEGKYFRYDSSKGIDPDYPGIHARLLDYIAHEGNFTWRNSFGVWTQEERGNRTWTDILVWGVAKFDVMAAQFSQTGSRINKGISFVEGHYDGSLIMVRDVQPEDTKIQLWNFFRPFEPLVWLAISIVIFLSSLAFQLIERIGEDPDSAQKSFRKKIMKNLYLSFINFTGNYSYEPKTLGGRIFGFFFAFWAMLITAAYTANLASILVVTNLPAPKIKNVQDAFEQGLSICVYQGTVQEEYLVENFPEFQKYLVPVAGSKMAETVKAGGCEIMVQSKQEFQNKRFQNDYNPTCTLEWQGRQILQLSDGFATKLDPGLSCTDLVNEVFTYYINEMKQNGKLEEFWNEHIEFYDTDGHCDEIQEIESRRLRQNSGFLNSDNSERNIGSAEDTESDSNALSLYDLAGTMLFQLMGSLVAIVLALISGCDRNTKIKRETRKVESIRNCTMKEVSIDDSVRDQLDEISRQLQDLNRFSDQLAVLNEKITKMERLEQQFFPSTKGSERESNRSRKSFP